MLRKTARSGLSGSVAAVVATGVDRAGSASARRVGPVPAGQIEHVLSFLVGEIEELTRIFADLGDDEIAEEREQVPGHRRDVVALIRKIPDDSEAARCVALHERRSNVVKHLAASDA